jgi:hypothetical protein
MYVSGRAPRVCGSPVILPAVWRDAEPPVSLEGPGFEVVAEGMRRAHGRVGEEYERLLRGRHPSTAWEVKQRA